MKRTGTLVKRGDYWHAKYTIEGLTFTKPLNTTLKSEADTELNRMMDNRQSGLDQYESYLKGEIERIRKFRANDKQSSPLLSDVWDKFIRHPHRPHCGEENLKQYKTAWTNFYAGLPPDRKRIADVVENDAHAYMESLYNRGIALGTAKKHRNFLEKIFSLLLYDGQNNPFKNAVARDGADHSLDYRPVSLDQTRAIS